MVLQHLSYPKLFIKLIKHNIPIDGLYNLSSYKISKYDLLNLQ